MVITLKTPFLNSLVIFFCLNTYTKGVCTRDFCTKNIYGDTYIRGVYIEGTSTKDAGISSTYNMGTFIRNAYICNVGTIKCSEIYLQFFQILEIGGARLFPSK